MSWFKLSVWCLWYVFTIEFTVWLRRGQEMVSECVLSLFESLAVQSVVVIGCVSTMLFTDIYRVLNISE